MQLRLSAFNTPYGDAQLEPVGISHSVRQKLVWEELEYRMKKGLPVKVISQADWLGWLTCWHIGRQSSRLAGWLGHQLVLLLASRGAGHG